MKNFAIDFLFFFVLPLAIYCSCDSNCESCLQEENICTICKPDTLLLKGRCFNSCPYSYYPTKSQDSLRHECIKISQVHQINDETLILFDMDEKIVKPKETEMIAFKTEVNIYHYKMCFWFKLAISEIRSQNYSLFLLTNHYGLYPDISTGKILHLWIRNNEFIRLELYNSKIIEIPLRHLELWNKISLGITNENGIIILNDQIFTYSAKNKVRWKIPKGISLGYFGNTGSLAGLFTLKLSSLYLTSNYDANIFEEYYNISSFELVERTIWVLHIRDNTFQQFKIYSEGSMIRFIRDFIIDKKNYLQKCSIFGIVDSTNRTLLNKQAFIESSELPHLYYTHTEFKEKFSQKKILVPGALERIYITRLADSLKIHFHHQGDQEEYEIDYQEDLYFSIGAQNGLEACRFIVQDFVQLKKTKEKSFNIVNRKSEIQIEEDYIKSNSDGKCTTREGYYCLKCNSGILFHGICIDNCPLGFRELEGHCIFNYSRFCLDNLCQNCIEGYTSHDNKCIKTCKKEEWVLYEPSINDFTCNKCSITDCGSCLDGLCHECKNNKFLFEGKCVEQCPDGTHSIDGECLKCPKYCEKCDQNGCLQCNENKLLILESGLCFSECPYELVKIDNLYCVEKDPDCILYKDGKCTGCKNGLYEHIGSCLQACPISHPFLYKNRCVSNCNGMITFEHTCRSCPGNCTRCDNFGCTKCADNLLIQNQICVPECHSLFIANESGYCNYIPIENCNMIASSTDCYSCALGYLMHEGLCQKSCPSGFLISNENCVIECEPHQLYIPSEGKCVDACPSGTFQNDSLCSPCLDKCRICENIDGCFECETHHYNIGYQNQLVDCERKPNTFSPEKRENSKFIFKEFPLFENCSPDPFRLKKMINNKCLICNVTVSFHILSGMLLDAGHGLEKVSLEYPSCTPCDNNCELCDEKGESCLLCKPGYYNNFYGSCDKECPVSFFKDDVKRLCLGCEIHCLRCLNFETCLYYDKVKNDVEVEVKAPEKYVNSNHLYLYIDKFSAYKLRRAFDKINANQLDPCKICQFFYRNNEAALIEFAIELDCNRICSKKMFCDPLCELCDPDNPKICFKCTKEFKGLYLNEVANCTCPESNPYLDHRSKACVPNCINCDSILQETRECLNDCFEMSYFDEKFYPFAYNGYCLASCPSNSYKHLQEPMRNKIQCIPKKNITVYESLLKIIESSQIASESEKCSYFDADFQNQFDVYASSFSSEEDFQLLYQENVFEFVFFYVQCAKSVSSLSRNLIEKILHIEIQRCIMNNIDITDRLILSYLKLSDSDPQETVLPISSLTLLISQAFCFDSLFLGQNIVKMTSFGVIFFLSTTYLRPVVKVEDSFEIEFDMEGIYYPLLIYKINSTIIYPYLDSNFHIHEGPLFIKGVSYDSHRNNLANISFVYKKHFNIFCYYMNIANQISSEQAFLNTKSSKITCPIKLENILFLGTEKLVFNPEEDDLDDEVDENNFYLLYIFVLIAVLVIVFGLKYLPDRAKNNKPKFIQLKEFDQDEDEESKNDDEKEVFNISKERTGFESFEDYE